MKKNSVFLLTKISIITALYIVITLLLYNYSFYGIQFRIAEAFILLILYRKEYSISLILGCLIVNIFSPLGIYDIVFGTFATVLSVICMLFTKNKIIASLYPVIFNGIIVGLELYFVLDLPFWLSALQVATGEFVVVTLFGVTLFSFLEKREVFRRLFEIGEYDKRH